MTIYSSPFLAPLRWMFGWRHLKDVATLPPDAYPSEMQDYGNDTGIDGALQIATVWACIRLISETIGTLPMLVYRRRPDGGKDVAADHPLYELLHDAPNAYMTALEFWEGVATSLCTHGNAYAEKMYLGTRLVAIEPIAADSVEIIRRNGRRLYRISEDGKKQREVDEARIFHVRGFGVGGDYGLSPIAYARYTLFGARAADRASAKLFASGNRQQGVLEMDQTLDKDQRTQVRENIIQPFIEGKTLVLEAGMKFKPTTLTPEDAQMLGSRSFQIEEICRWFRVPPFMVGHTEKSTSWGTGLEQQQIGFLIFALEPYLERIEQSIRRSLIAPPERKDIAAEFKVEKLLRTDSAARATFYSQMVTNGIMTRNEARGLENLPPKEGADELTAQAQNVPVGSPAPQPQGIPA